MATNNIEWLQNELRKYNTKLERAEELNKPGNQNPVYQILTLVTEEVFPFFVEESPVWTGLLKDSHRKSDVTISKSGSGVRAESTIDINPNTRDHPIIRGTFPRDYGPKYHREERPWFSVAAVPAIDLMDRIVNEQYRLWLEVIAL